MAEAEASLPPSMRLDIVTVIENLLLDRARAPGAAEVLAQLVDNLKAIGVIDEHGKQVSGQMIRELQGMDGLFIFYILFNHQLDYVELRELVEYLIDHDIIQRVLDRKGEDAKKEWMRTKLRELRVENPQSRGRTSRRLYEKEHPRELTKIELHPQRVRRQGPASRAARRQEGEERVGAARGQWRLTFLEFVDKHGLEHEEGNLFSYLVRVMNFAQQALRRPRSSSEFEDMAERVQEAARADRSARSSKALRVIGVISAMPEELAAVVEAMHADEVVELGGRRVPHAATTTASRSSASSAGSARSRPRRRRRSCSSGSSRARW